MFYFECELFNVERYGLINVNFLLKRLSFLFFLIVDYVYFENFFSNLYLIRRIEEFNKVYI